jgi:hypothetical protein
MTKLLILFFGVAIFLNAQNTNIFSGIIERNAFNLTEEKPIKISPPAINILSGNIYLTGITRLNKVRKAYLVIKRIGEPDKHVSLLEKQLKSGIRLERAGTNIVNISDNGRSRFLSLKSNSPPTKLVSSGRARTVSKSMPRSDKKTKVHKKLLILGKGQD